MEVSTIPVGSKSVILVDCSNKTTEHAGEIKDILNQAKALVAKASETRPCGRAFYS